MAYKAPGKHYRKGITLLELAQMFPNEAAAREWFENILWPNGKRYCPRCGSDNTHEASHIKMPYRCRDCRKYFSVKTGTVMADSPLPLLKWVYAIYLDLTSLKGVSSMKLHRDLGITQKSAWYMQQRIREGFLHEGSSVMAGPVEVDETYMGGKERNKHESKKLKAGRGTVGKTAVVGAKDRATGQVSAEVVQATDAETLQGFVTERAAEDATVYSDENRAYRGAPPEARNRQSLGRRVHRRDGPHQRGRVLLVDAQTGPQGHLPQDISPSTCNGTSMSSRGVTICVNSTP